MTNNLSDLNGTLRDTSATAPFPANTAVYRPNLRYEVDRVSNEGEKRLSLAPLLRGTEGNGVIYAATVREVKAVADYLKQAGFDVAPYHGQLGADEKTKNRDRFLYGALKAIIAVSDSGAEPYSISADMDTEIDRPDISFVIHYNMPASLEDYYRESGRAGRDGRPARCVLLFQIADRRTQSFATNGRSPMPEEVIAVYAALKALGADLAPASLIQTSARDAQNQGARHPFAAQKHGAHKRISGRALHASETGPRRAGDETAGGRTHEQRPERP